MLPELSHRIEVRQAEQDVHINQMRQELVLARDVLRHGERTDVQASRRSETAAVAEAQRGRWQSSEGEETMWLKQRPCSIESVSKTGAPRFEERTTCKSFRKSSRPQVGGTG